MQAKTRATGIRLDRQLDEVVLELASREERSPTNMMQVLMREALRARGLLPRNQEEQVTPTSIGA